MKRFMDGGASHGGKNDCVQVSISSGVDATGGCWASKMGGKGMISGTIAIFLWSMAAGVGAKIGWDSGDSVKELAKDAFQAVVAMAAEIGPLGWWE